MPGTFNSKGCCDDDDDDDAVAVAVADDANTERDLQS